MLGARTGGQDHQGRPPPPCPPSWPRLSWSLPMGTQSSRPTALPAPSHAHSLPLCPRLPDAGLPARWVLRHRARSSRGLVARSRLCCRPGPSPTSKPQSHHALPGTKRIPSPIGGNSEPAQEDRCRPRHTSCPDGLWGQFCSPARLPTPRAEAAPQGKGLDSGDLYPPRGLPNPRPPQHVSHSELKDPCTPLGLGQTQKAFVYVSSLRG